MESIGDTTRPDISPFTSHTACLEAGHIHFTLRVLKMNGSTMLFINAKESETFNELAVAMPARDSSQQVLSSTIIGCHSQTDSSVLAGKLSKRFGRHFYVSLNLQVTSLVGTLFDKTLIGYIREHQEHPVGVTAAFILVLVGRRRPHGRTASEGHTLTLVRRQDIDSRYASLKTEREFLSNN